MTQFSGSDSTANLGAKLLPGDRLHFPIVFGIVFGIAHDRNGTLLRAGLRGDLITGPNPLSFPSNEPLFVQVLEALSISLLDDSLPTQPGQNALKPFLFPLLPRPFCSPSFWKRMPVARFASKRDTKPPPSVVSRRNNEIY